MNLVQLIGPELRLTLPSNGGFAVRVAASLLVALALGACGLPSRDRIQADLQAIAEAGAPPEAVTVEVVALERGDGDMGAFEQTVVYDLKVWRDGRLIGPLAGGVAEVRAGRHLRGGRATVTYVKTEGPWVLTGLALREPPSPAAARP